LAGLVQAADFPSTWTSSVGTTSPGSVVDPAVAKLVSVCAGVGAQTSKDNKLPWARSLSYSDPNTNNQFQNGVWQYKSAAAATAAYNVYASADAVSCDQQGLTKAFNASLAGSTTTSDGVGPNVAGTGATVATAALGVPAVGDATSAIIMTVTISSPGITSSAPVTKQVTLVVQQVRVGRYLVRYNAALYQPIAAASLPSLVAVTIARLEAGMKK
jgi:hypothetical protein